MDGIHKLDTAGSLMCQNGVIPKGWVGERGLWWVESKALRSSGTVGPISVLTPSCAAQSPLGSSDTHDQDTQAIGPTA